MLHHRDAFCKQINCVDAEECDHDLIHLLTLCLAPEDWHRDETWAILLTLQVLELREAPVTTWEQLPTGQSVFS